jgi:hypothetical protein
MNFVPRQTHGRLHDHLLVLPLFEHGVGQNHGYAHFSLKGGRIIEIGTKRVYYYLYGCKHYSRACTIKLISTVIYGF